MRTDIFSYTDEAGKTRYADPTLLLEDLYFFADLAGLDYPDLLRRASASKVAKDDNGKDIFDEVPVVREAAVLDENGQPKLDDAGEVVTEVKQVLNADGSPMTRQRPRYVRDFKSSRDATNQLRDVIAQAFGVKAWDAAKPEEAGLRAGDIDGLLNEFYDFKAAKKKPRGS